MDVATSSDDLAEDGLLSSFSQQHAQQFFATLDTFLHGYDPQTTSDAADLKLVHALGAILDVYLPAPPLLDPYLGRMIAPLLEATHDLLRSALLHHPRPPATTSGTSSSSSLAALSGLNREPPRVVWETSRLQRLGTALWWILKVRSWKACLTHFPPSLPHLPLLLSLLYPVPHPTLLPADSWQLRYILLAHLSLVALVPFNLDSAGGLGTREAVWQVGCAAVINGRGKEAQAGVILVAKLMARPDCSHLLPEFLALSSVPALQVLQTIAHLLPSCSASQLSLLREHLASLPRSDAATEKSALVRKLRIKTSGRVGVRALRLAGRRERSAKRGFGKKGGRDQGVEEQDEELAGDSGEGEEEVIQELLDGLEDKVNPDTIVRWSAAKYLARLCALLPSDFALQLSSAVVGLFARDVISAEEEGGQPDVSAVKEGGWHGACLAVAELARRGVLDEELLPEVVPWLIHATTYDPFTISHSTGSAVRDASFYALWSLSRCFTKDQIRPWAVALACACVGASVCDREVGIRRSGSAAFQEGVGRLGVYPEGIDVLSKTDFYSVGIRRTAFLSVAPQVAQHQVYRTYLLDRYESSTLRHWDKDVRALAAQALAAIAVLNLEAIGPALGVKMIGDVQRTLDGTWTHGLVLALGHLAEAWRQSDSHLAESERFKILQTITRLRPQLFTSFSADLHLTACCNLVAQALSPAALENAEIDVAWRNFVSLGLKSRNSDVWEGVSRVWAEVSKSKDLKTFNAITQQALAKVLGGLRFEHTAGCAIVLQRLLELVEVGSINFVSDVEARRNAYQAVCAIASEPANRQAGQHAAGLDQAHLARTIAALLRGLDDYTSDQRGDVGSWIRLACLRGSADLVASILGGGRPEDWLTIDQYRDVLGKILKLAAERIDGVRRGAGEALRKVVMLETGAEKEWLLPGSSDLRALFVPGPDAVRWNEASSVVSRLVRLMAFQPYRRPILEGLSLSIGSLSEGTSKPASTAFLEYIATLPPSALSPSEPSLLSISRSLVDIAASNVTLNRVFIPVLDTLVLLFEDSDLARLSGTTSGKAAVRSIFLTATKDLARIRNIQRVQACMRIITGMLAIPACATDAVKHLPTLLNHRFPTIRSATAEQLYLVLQSMDVDDSEELEETLLNTTWTGDDVAGETRTVCRLLREHLRD